MTCSCPDWEVPCKHLAAVCYVLAEAFDADPFGMLAWRGKGREDLLAALRRLTGGGPAPRRPAAARSLTSPMPRCRRARRASGRRRSARLGCVRCRQPLAAPADLLLRSFEPPFITAGGMDLVTLLRPAYLAMTSSDQVSPQDDGEAPGHGG